MASPTPADVTRRTMLRTAGVTAVAVPVLAACGDEEPDTSGGPSAPQGSDTPGTPSGSPSASGSPTDGGGGADVLAKASDVEVGGALFLSDDQLVITQPAAGEFSAFDTTCTHQQCAVSSVSDGKILCPCHGSMYDLATGKNVGGPAPAPLTKIDIAVEGDNIVKA